MTTVRMRRYAGPGDLRAMQTLAQRVWSPSSLWHIGDLAWQRSHPAGHEPNWPTALWEAGGEVLAWGWAEPPGELFFQVDPSHPDLTTAVLDWFTDVATTSRTTVTVLDSECHLTTALESYGYVRQYISHHCSYMTRPLDDLPEPELPSGFRARPVRGEVDLPSRVAVHRAAWAPSLLTEDRYRNVMSTWPYRPDLDWVIEAPDGTFAANCLLWFDDRNAVGELEPVGTAPDFRRRGLARAVCLAALHRLRDLGAQSAIVYPVADRPGPVALYGDLGFRPYARTVTFAKNS
ncbi:GNAT family N-acetyltransferase [Nocardia puris]|nr:GNAT family N-acetyltransferase [Nocardia puris]